MVYLSSMSKKEQQFKKEEEKFKHRQLREIVLAALGIGVLVGGTLVTPNFPIVLGSIISIIKEFKKKDIPEAKVRRVLANLERKKIITIEKKGDEVVVYLKDRLTASVLKYSLKTLLDFKKKEKKWQGKWYLVFFDVPEIQRNKRNYLRNFLRDIGFFQYQQSVYVYPYECEKEIVLIKQIVESAQYMSYIIADKIEQEQRVKIYFNLT